MFRLGLNLTVAATPRQVLAEREHLQVLSDGQRRELLLVDVLIGHVGTASLRDSDGPGQGIVPGQITVPVHLIHDVAAAGVEVVTGRLPASSARYSRQAWVILATSLAISFGSLILTSSAGQPGRRGRGSPQAGTRRTA